MGLRLRALVVACCLALVGCTTDGGGPGTAAPSPSPATNVPVPPPITGPRVAVVLAAGPGILGSVTAQEEAVERVRSSFADQLSVIRDVTVDDPVFLADVVGLLAEEEYELVCAIGDGVVDAVLTVAADYPRTKFCAFPAVASEVPANVLVMDLAVEQVGFLAGAVAARLAPAAPRAMVGSREVYGIDRLQNGFRAGARTSNGGQEAEVLVGFPADDPETAASFTASHIEAGAQVIFVVTGDADVSARADAAAAEAGVIGAAATLWSDDEHQPPGVLLGLRVGLEPVLRLAIDRLLGTWATSPATFGVADDALQLVPGGHPRAEAAARLAAEVQAAIISGQVTVPSGG